MTAAYQGMKFSAATVPPTRLAVTSAIEPNRTAAPTPAAAAGALRLRGKWPLAAKPCIDAASTSAMNSAVRISAFIDKRHDPIRGPALRLTGENLSS